MALNNVLVAIYGSITYLPLSGQHPSTVAAANGPTVSPELPAPLLHLGGALADWGGTWSRPQARPACCLDAHPQDTGWLKEKDLKGPLQTPCPKFQVKRRGETLGIKTGHPSLKDPSFHAHCTIGSSSILAPSFQAWEVEKLCLPPQAALVLGLVRKRFPCFSTLVISPSIPDSAPIPSLIGAICCPLSLPHPQLPPLGILLAMRAIMMSSKAPICVNC